MVLPQVGGVQTEAAATDDQYVAHAQDQLVHHGALESRACVHLLSLAVDVHDLPAMVDQTSAEPLAGCNSHLLVVRRHKDVGGLTYPEEVLLQEVQGNTGNSHVIAHVVVGNCGILSDTHVSAQQSHVATERQLVKVRR